MIFVASLCRFYAYLTAKETKEDFHISRTSPDMTAFAKKAYSDLLSSKERLLLILDGVDTSEHSYIKKYKPSDLSNSRAHQIFVTEFHGTNGIQIETITTKELNPDQTARLYLANRRSCDVSDLEDQEISIAKETLTGIQLHPAEAIVLGKTVRLTLRSTQSRDPNANSAANVLLNIIPAHDSTDLRGISVKANIWNAARNLLSSHDVGLLRLLIAMQTSSLSLEM